jgi:PAS domain S-box-containing protein
MFESSKKRSFYFLIWIVTLTLSFFGISNFSYTDKFLLQISFTANLLIIFAMFFVFVWSILAYINRDDDKFIFLVIVAPIILVLKFIILIKTPDENLTELISPFLTEIQLYNKITSVTFLFFIMVRNLTWVYGFQNHAKYKLNYTYRYISYGLIFKFIFILVIITSYNFYPNSDLYFAIIFALPLIYIFSTIIYYVKNSWIYSTFEMLFFIMLIGFTAIEISNFLMIYFQDKNMFYYATLVEISNYFFVIIGFTISSYALTQREADTKKNLVINNIKMQLAKDRTEIALKQVEEEERKISTIVDNIADAIITIDKELIVHSFNKAAEQMFGYTKEEVIGNSEVILIPKRFHKSHFKFLHELFSHTNDFDINKKREVYRSRKNGKIFPAEISLREITLHEKQLLIMIIRDITELREAQRQLEEYHETIIQAKEEAERANKLKSTFLANITHELRTPMNSILGFSGLILKNLHNVEKTKEYAGIIKTNGTRLLRLINNVLDLAKVESGKIEIHKKQFSIHSLVKTIDLLAPLKKNKDIALSFNIGKDLPKEIISDEEKIIQILVNLAGNAIKFTEEGFVKISIELQDETTLKFSIEDSGIGIDEKSLSQIFDEFYQVGGEIQKEKGSGLGLSISKQLVQAFKGKIWAESKKEQGTTFYFTIKFEKVKTFGDEQDILNEKTSEKNDELVFAFISEKIEKSAVHSLFEKVNVDFYHSPTVFLEKANKNYSAIFISVENVTNKIFEFANSKKIELIAVSLFPNFPKDKRVSKTCIFSKENINEILLNYGVKVTNKVNLEINQFIKNQIMNIASIQFFRKSEIIENLEKLIPSCSKDLQKELKICLRDVEHHNKSEFYLRLQRIIDGL